MKKVLLFVVLVVVFVIALPFLLRGLRSIEPKKVTFDGMIAHLAGQGFNVSERRTAALVHRGSTEGAEVLVNGGEAIVRMFKFENSGVLNIAFENSKESVGDGIAQSMGITTQLGVQVAPRRDKKHYPVKKGGQLFVVHCDNKALTQQLLDAIKHY